MNAYDSLSITSNNITSQGASFEVNADGYGYCCGNPNTQLKVEYYYMSSSGEESPHYFVPVGS